MIVGDVASNLITSSRRLTRWLGRMLPTLDLIMEFSMGVFLSMSLVSLHLWTLVGLLDVVIPIIAIQFLFALIVNI